MEVSQPEILSNQICENYLSKNNLSKNKKFHFNSRMFLWTKDNKYKLGLDSLYPLIYGSCDDEIFQKFNSVYHKILIKKLETARAKARIEYFKKYPKLQNINRILFKYLFAKTIFRKNLSQIVCRVVDNNFLMEMYSQLTKDHTGLGILSTHAVNYLHLCGEYLSEFGIAMSLQSELCTEVFNKMDKSNTVDLQLSLYLLTHLIIGATNFYEFRYSGKIYNSILMTIQNTIEERYEEVSLDIKNEFMVCAKLVFYDIPDTIKNRILKENLDNYSPNLGYITNPNHDSHSSFSTSEHRNVLFIMANTPCKIPTLSKKS